MVTLQTFDRTPARLKHAEANGDAGRKAHAEFGIDFPDAYLLALKEAKQEPLNIREHHQLAGYRFFKDRNLTPDQVRTAVYFFTLIRENHALTQQQKDLYVSYCKKARVTDPNLDSCGIVTDELHKA